MEAGVTATATATATARSVLDKPLHELTEDDISQLTREDCRRYLKEKGMRRPSWNKSQAIQQVISLKSLLEPPPTTPATAAAGGPPPPPKSTNSSFARPPPPLEIPTPPHVNSNSTGSAKDLSPADVDDGGPSFPTALPVESDPAREAGSGYPPGADHQAESFRTTDPSNSQVGQMTIFYCGKVNVYDRVPAEKAHAIMQLAASPVQLFGDDPVVGSSAQWPITNLFPTSSVRVDVITPSVAVSQSMQTGKTRDYVPVSRQEGNVHEPDIEGQTNRQVSLQRYLEKKKDRGRLKNKKKTGCSSGLEMYLNNQMRIQVISGKSSVSGGTSSPSQPGQSNIVCGSVESQLKDTGRSLDLNDKF